MKKHILSTISIISTAFIFNACGGSDEASFKESNTIVPINITCTTPATIDTYIELQSNDTIVKNQENTKVEIYHDVNGLKKVCLVSGSASIVRQ